MKKSAYILLMAAMTVLAGCSGSDKGGDTPTPKTYKVTISSGSSSTVGTSGGSASISFNASDNWTASASAGWCSLDVTSGASGNNTITVTASANESYDERNASVTITCGSASAKATVTQKQKDAILVSSDKLEIDYNGGDASITVQSNVQYTWSITSGSEWIKQGSATKGLKASTIYLDIDENWDQTVRQGEITVQSGEMSETVTVYQQASTPRIVISEPEVDVKPDDTEFKVELKSNCDYTLVMPEVDWLREKPETKGASQYTYTFEVDKNETYDSRTAEIKFINSETQEVETVTVTQLQKNAIIIAKNQYDVNYKGETLKFDVATNVDFETSIDCDWITETESETKGLEDVPVCFTVAPNDGMEAREGKITFSYTENDEKLEQTVTINQNCESKVVISQKEYNLSDAETEIKVELVSNCDYTLIMPEVDWITEKGTKAVTEHEHTFTIAANGTYDARSAEILFRNNDTYGFDTVVVNQAQKNGIVIAQKEYDVEFIGDTLNFNVATNVEFTSKADVDWITEITPDTKGLVDVPVSFKVEPNASMEAREGKITFTDESGKIEQVVTVRQKCESKIVISQKEYNLSSSGEDITVQLVSNCNYEIVMPKVDWITEQETKAVAEYTHVFTVAANETYDSRSAQILFKNLDTSLFDTVVVNQAQKNGIVVAETEYEIGYRKDTLQFNVATNVEFETAISANWITEIEPQTKGLEDVPVCFQIAENNSGNVREGTITFSYTEGGSTVSQTVKITQNFNNNVTVVKITHNGKDFTVPSIDIADGVIDWGDGSKTEKYMKRDRHVYSSSSEWTVTIQFTGDADVEFDKLSYVTDVEITKGGE